MIWLGSEYLMFKMPSGESVAFSSDAIAVEIVDETNGDLDTFTVKQAANAVYHYFKHELGRQSVSVADFAQAMEKALDGFEISIVSAKEAAGSMQVAETDLCQVADRSGFELDFFPNLRRELNAQLRSAPQVVRFKGLRGCVKQLAGAKRWSARCVALQEQIVGYVRGCLSADAADAKCVLVVE